MPIVCYYLKDEEFQFPTGWNSTGFGITLTAASKGFNSQRDGILHERGQTQNVRNEGFNSQRDGILLTSLP